MATRKKKTDEVWPKVTVGSHLTVTTYEDGKTELAWDDAALLKEIQSLSGTAPATKPKRKTKDIKGLQ